MGGELFRSLRCWRFPRTAVEEAATRWVLGGGPVDFGEGNLLNIGEGGKSY